MKKNLLIPLIIAFSLLCVLGIIFYFYSSRPDIKNISTEQVSSTTIADETEATDAKMQATEDHADKNRLESMATTTLYLYPSGLFSLQYPSIWTREDTVEGPAFFKNKDERSFYLVMGLDLKNILKQVQEAGLISTTQKWKEVSGFNVDKISLKDGEAVKGYYYSFGPFATDKGYMNLLIVAVLPSQGGEAMLQEFENIISFIKIDRTKIDPTYVTEAARSIKIDDGTYKSNMFEFRKEAEEYFRDNGNSYVNLCSANNGVTLFLYDLKKNLGDQNVRCIDTANSYSLSVKFKDSTYGCMDRTGYSNSASLVSASSCNS